MTVLSRGAPSHSVMLQHPLQGNIRRALSRLLRVSPSGKQMHCTNTNKWEQALNILANPSLVIAKKKKHIIFSQQRSNIPTAGATKNTRQWLKITSAISVNMTFPLGLVLHISQLFHPVNLEPFHTSRYWQSVSNTAKAPSNCGTLWCTSVGKPQMLKPLWTQPLTDATARTCASLFPMLPFFQQLPQRQHPVQARWCNVDSSLWKCNRRGSLENTTHPNTCVRCLTHIHTHIYQCAVRWWMGSCSQLH